MNSFNDRVVIITGRGAGIRTCGRVAIRGAGRTGPNAFTVKYVRDLLRARAYIAHWIVSLASPAAAWITGQVVALDGGVSIA